MHPQTTFSKNNVYYLLPSDPNTVEFLEAS